MKPSLFLAGLLAAPLVAQTPAVKPCPVASQAHFPHVIDNRITQWPESLSGVYVTLDTVRWRTGRCAFATAPVVPPTTPPPVTPPSGSFSPPDIVANASFEADWEGFNNGGSSAPTGVTRTTTRGYDGTASVCRSLPTSTTDVGASFFAQFYDATFSHFGAQAANRVWVRFYVYVDAPFDGILKLEQFYQSSNDNYGGWYFNGGFLGWAFAEALTHGGTIYNMVPLSSLVNGWHSIEADFWHQGDGSAGADYPSVALYLDGQPITTGQGQPTGGTRWLNGRLNAGFRNFSGPVGNTNILGVKNPGNHVTGTVCVDRIAVSTKGRIGP